MNGNPLKNLAAAKNDALHALPRIILPRDQSDATNSKENLPSLTTRSNTQPH